MRQDSEFLFFISTNLSAEKTRSQKQVDRKENFEFLPSNVPQIQLSIIKTILIIYPMTIAFQFY